MYLSFIKSSQIQLPIFTNKNADKSEAQQYTESSETPHSESDGALSSDSPS
jgi:hypothetical protein